MDVDAPLDEMMEYDDEVRVDPEGDAIVASSEAVEIVEAEGEGDEGMAEGMEEEVEVTEVAEGVEVEVEVEVEHTTEAVEVPEVEIDGPSSPANDKIDEDIEYDAGGATDVEDGEDGAVDVPVEAAVPAPATVVEPQPEAEAEAKPEPEPAAEPENVAPPTPVSAPEVSEVSESHEVETAADAALEPIEEEVEGEGEGEYYDEELPPLAPILLHLPGDYGTRALFNPAEEEEGADAPALPVYLAGKDELAEESLTALLAALREEMAAEGVSLQGEFVLVEKMMDLKMGEDDINLQSITLLDLLTLHEGCGLPTPVQLFVTDVPHRFITRFEAIKREVAAADARESARNSADAEDAEEEHDEIMEEGEEEGEYEYNEDEEYFEEGEEYDPEAEVEAEAEGEAADNAQAEPHAETDEPQAEAEAEGDDAAQEGEFIIDWIDLTEAQGTEHEAEPDTVDEHAHDEEVVQPEAEGAEPKAEAEAEAKAPAEAEADEPAATEKQSSETTDAATKPTAEPDATQAPEADETGDFEEDGDTYGIDAIGDAALAASAEDANGEADAAADAAEAAETNVETADEEGYDELADDDAFGVDAIAENALAASADATHTAASESTIAGDEVAHEHDDTAELNGEGEEVAEYDDGGEGEEYGEEAYIEGEYEHGDEDYEYDEDHEYEIVEGDEGGHGDGDDSGAIYDEAAEAAAEGEAEPIRSPTKRARELDEGEADEEGKSKVPRLEA